MDKRIILPIGFTCLLLAVRIIITGELTYIFLAWNLFLAWIPYAISQSVAGGISRQRWKEFTLLGLWLLFLPNAPYIITDLLHLKHRAPVPYWYDVLLLFSAALNGLMLGFASLLKVEQFLAGRFSKRVSTFLILCTFFLCAFGIYAGRWLRWNSWDVFLNPAEIAGDILDRLLNPFAHFRTWAVTLLFGSFLYIAYFTLKNFIYTKTSKT